jgi:hypothetical protein
MYAFLRWKLDDRSDQQRAGVTDMGEVINRTSQASVNSGKCRCRWSGRAAVTWATLFAVPHLWWAFGIPVGFPGGMAGLKEARAVPWFVAYDLQVVALSVIAALVALAAVRRKPVASPLAWGACVVLLARGVTGLVVDGFADLVWSPMFVVGGLLFGTTAWLCGRSTPRLGRGSGSGGDAVQTRIE